jgi:tetratricopeptide (TPR) repeat protein
MDQKELSAKLARSESKAEKISLLDSYAGKLFERGRFKEAAKYYIRALEMASLQNARAYFCGQAGICHYTDGNDQEALQYLVKSARLFAPDKPEFMPDMCGFVNFHLGSLYEYLGKQTKSLEARKICEQYIESQEKDTQWMLYAGISRTYEAMGKHESAILYSQKALQVLSDNDPGLTYIYESMGNNYMNLKQYQEAITYFSKVTELDPRFERIDEIQFKMADCYRQLMNDRMALETYKKMIELKHLTGKKEGLIQLYILKAECYFRLEEYEKSLLVTLEAVRRQPRNKLEKIEIQSFLTNNYYELGRYVEAIREGEKTLSLGKRFHNDHLFYFRMALSYHRLGDKKAFARYKALCKRLFPSDSWNAYLAKLA